MSNEFREVVNTARLRRSFYRGDPLDVGLALLNKVFKYDDPRHGSLSGRIVEVEAYGGSNDPASHAYRGRTKRNSTMFGEGGHLYTYFTYGMHWCANAVCGQEGVAGAVLIRALEPLSGLDAMRDRRPAARRDTDLCNGPAKICQALSLGAAHDGTDLTSGSVSIVDDGLLPPKDPGRGTRIGLTKGTDLPWRLYVAGDPHLSR